MSDADATAEPTVTVEEITVTKSYETDEFPVPAVAFRFRSARDDEAIIQLTDDIPENVPPEDLGFHPDYGSDHWSVEDGNAVFERRLDPDEEYQTVYGIRTDDHDPEQFMTDPALDVQGLGDDTETAKADEIDGTETAETEDTEETPGRDSSQAARDVISGEGDVSGLDDEDDTVDEVDISGTETTETTETTDTAETTGETETAETAETSETKNESRTSERETDAGVTVSSGGVGAALAAEIRDGTLSDADRELLAEEFEREDAGSQVRITHLQSRISDLEAYTDALEDFIDEHGPARQLIEDMTDQLGTIEDQLDDLDGRTTENETDIEELDSRTEENATDIEALDEGTADLQSEIGTTQESVESLREDIEEINGWRTQISTVLGAPPPEHENEES